MLVMMFGLVMYGVFSRTLDRRLARLRLPSTEIRTVDAQKPRLAAMESSDPRVMAEVGESFLFGYRSILWLAVVLALRLERALVVLLDLVFLLHRARVRLRCLRRRLLPSI